VTTLATFINRLFEHPRFRSRKLRFEIIEKMPAVGTGGDFEGGGFTAEAFFQNNLRRPPGERTLCYLCLREAPLSRLLRYACLMTGMHWGIDEHGVVVADRDVPLPTGVVLQGPEGFRLKNRDEIDRFTGDRLRTPLPRIHYDDHDGVAVLKFLSGRSCDLDPDGIGLSLVFLVDRERVKPVTCHAENVPLQTVLSEVCRRAGVAFRIEPRTILIVPPSR